MVDAFPFFESVIGSEQESGFHKAAERFSLRRKMRISFEFVNHYTCSGYPEIL